MSYSIAWESRGTLIAYSGVVNFQDVMGAVFAIHQNPRYAHFKYAIHDMSMAERLDFTGVDMTQIVAHEMGARYTNPGIKVAIVTADPEMATRVETFTALTKLEIRLLASLAEARAQLDPV